MGYQVSIIISTYNRADTFLPRAIESALNQTYDNIEIIVVDDCSTDNTKAVVKSYKGVRYVRLPEHFGKDTKPKNVGIQKSKGSFIAYLDDDCEFYPEHIERLMDAMVPNSSAPDLVYCDMELVQEGVVGEGIALDFDPQILMYKNYIDTSMVLHRKEAIRKVGGWDEKLPRFVDWNLWVRMAKAGVTFKRIPEILTKYNVHENNSAKAYPVKSYRDPQFGILFEPTFDPTGCEIYLPYLGGERLEESNPRVAIFTITYDRKEYTQKMYQSMKNSAGYGFDWFVLDNGSTDGQKSLLTDLYTSDTSFKYLHLNEENEGLTRASNKLVSEIKRGNYQIIIKVDNDCEFMTKNWLSTLVDLWKRNHMLYMSPYVEGLVHNPGGAPRVGHSFIGPYFIEVTKHIGGIFAAIDASAYDNFKWTDQFLHGNQDVEASSAFVDKGYMPCYIPMHRVLHMDTTEGQQKKFPEYFKRRIVEKTKHYIN